MVLICLGMTNSFMVIIHALDPFSVDITKKAAERVAIDHYHLPASWYKGELPYRGLKALVG